MIFGLPLKNSGEFFENEKIPGKLIELNSIIEKEVIDPSTLDLFSGLLDSVTKKYGYHFEVKNSDLYTPPPC